MFAHPASRLGREPRVAAAIDHVIGDDALVERIPLAVFEAAVSVAGEALYWKSSLRHVMRNAGVSENGYARYADASKYQIFRSIWDDLDRAGNRGLKVQVALVGALANLDRPDPKSADPVAAQAAIENLRRLATGANLLVSPADLAKDARRRSAAESIEEVGARRSRLEALNMTLRELHRTPDKQSRGYAFEKLLTGIFRYAELDYSGSYKTGTDQIDGAVTIDSFTYLIEARWRSALAADAELGGLLHKVERRMDSTRGLFISMAGFRVEAVDLFRMSKDNRLILVNGMDIAWMLEGRIDVLDAFREKIKAASVRGEPFLQLGDL